MYTNTNTCVRSHTSCSAFRTYQDKLNDCCRRDKTERNCRALAMWVSLHDAANEERASERENDNTFAIHIEYYTYISCLFACVGVRLYKADVAGQRNLPCEMCPKCMARNVTIYNNNLKPHITSCWCFFQGFVSRALYFRFLCVSAYARECWAQPRAIVLVCVARSNDLLYNVYAQCRDLWATFRRRAQQQRERKKTHIVNIKPLARLTIPVMLLHSIAYSCKHSRSL